MVIFKLLLYPFAVLYDWITRLRNHLYTIGYKKSFRFETVVISVGNLNTGGAGKTPLIEYLIRLLQPTFKLATLSRGYGRRTKGIRFASALEDATTVGDEPFQLFQKFGSSVKVSVGEERAEAIPTILHEFPETEVILLDDAFQHRAVNPQLSILLTEYSKPFYKDYVLPFGRLREARKGAARADIVLVTKCSTAMSDEELNDIVKSIERYSGPKPVFFTQIEYELPIPFQAGNTMTADVILVSGLADASLFEEYARSKFNVLHHFRFADHHRYSLRNLESLVRFYQSRKEKPSLLTTEKDMVKLNNLKSSPASSSLPWFYLPVRMGFLKNGSDFDKLILQSIESAIPVT